MPVTIRDVARRLKLSITTVSRALDGYDDVAEGTRERVVRVARQMGYVPSRAARELRRKRADAIGFIMPTLKPRFADPFYSEFIAGLADEAASKNFDLLVSAAPPQAEAEQAAYRRWVQSHRVDGVVLARLRLKDWRVHYLAEIGLPFVGLGGVRRSVKYPRVVVDGDTGLRQLMAHLIERGHRRIGFVSAPPELAIQAERLAGYRAGLEAAGIPFDNSLVAVGNLTNQGGYQAAQGLLTRPDHPSAIIGVDDVTAMGVMRAVREAGLEVGRDVAVAGFDDISEAENAQPPLTTLRQPVYDVARRLVTMLLAIICGETAAVSEVVIQPELVVRASTGG
jgi:LacI family transcriptional regulator